jgi:hypothetical protein
VALRFLDAAKVDYVILRRGEEYTQYYKDWLTNGIPDRRAELVYGTPGPEGDDIMVVRWKRDGSHIPEESRQIH